MGQRTSIVFAASAAVLFGGLVVGCGSSKKKGSGSAVAPATSGTAPTNSTSQTGAMLVGITPTQAPSSGGLEVTITGQGFGSSAAVQFDGIPGVDVIVVDDSTIVCKTPAHTASLAPVDVVVTLLPAGTSLTLSGAFTFFQAVTPARGELDLTFQGTGYTTIDGAGASFDQAYDVMTDALKRIYVAGATTGAAGSTNRDFSIFRFLEDGTPDATWGTQGAVVLDGIAGATNDWDVANAMTFDATGRIVVTGFSYNTNTNADMVVLRFLDDGTPDATFGTNGVVVISDVAAVGFWDVGQDIMIDAQGRLVIVGYASSAGFNNEAVVWRLESTGALDTTFAGVGFVVLAGTAGGSGTDRAEAVMLDPQGRIVVAGYSANAAGNGDMVVWRFLDDGTLDPTFNSGLGYFVHDNAGGGMGTDSGRAIALDDQGRIVVGGTSFGVMNAEMAVWRLTTDGVLDAAFGGGRGVVTYGNQAGGDGSDLGFDMVLDPRSDRIVIVGNSFGANVDIAVTQLTGDGSLDTAFGNGLGYVTHDNAAGGMFADQAREAAFDADGRILVVGSSAQATNNSDLAIWRYR